MLDCICGATPAQQSKGKTLPFDVQPAIGSSSIVSRPLVTLKLRVQTRLRCNWFACAPRPWGPKSPRKLAALCRRAGFTKLRVPYCLEKV